MPELLFKLRNVPEDEADEVRALLNDNSIRYYETDEGSWKIAVPAIWLPDASQLQQARNLLAEYQSARLQQARARREQEIAAGTAPTLWTMIRRNPVRFLLYLGGAGVIIYLSLMPFVRFGD